MARKVVLKRDFFKKQSNVNYKYFLWAGVGLLILVVVTPLITKRRTEVSGPQKPSPEAGMVMKEIPKSSPSEMQASQPPPESAALSHITESSVDSGSAGGQAESANELNGQTSVGEEKLPATAGAIPESPESTQDLASGTVQPQSQPQPSGSSEPQPSPQPAAQSHLQPQASEQASPTPPAQQSLEPAPGSGQATAASGAETQPAGQSEATAEQTSVMSQPTSAPPAEKSPAESGSTRYVVQIGSFSQKKNAESVQQSLSKKGYAVVLRTIDHAKFGRLYVVQLEALSDPVKAESLLAKVKKEANVKPMMVRIPAGQ